MFAAGTALVLCDAWLAARWGTHGAVFYTKELAQVMGWLVAGELVARLRPRSRMGALMTGLGLLLAAAAPASFALAGTGLALRLPVAAGLLLTALQLPLGAHVFLAYPSGEVHDREGRAVARAGYVFGALCALVLVVFGPARPAGRCRDVCAPLSLVDDPGAARTAAQALAAGTAALVLVGASVIMRRFRRAGGRERRLLAFPTAAMITAAVLWATLNLLSTAELPPAGATGVDSTLAAAQFTSLLAVPAAFFLGLLRERLYEARVSDLVRVIAVMPAGRLEAALAAALGDPQLRVAYPVTGGWADGAGAPVTLPEAPDPRRLTVVGPLERPVAVLLHDPTLRDEPRLLEAVTATARLALENARLEAEVRARLAEVRASRARLVTAADAARRRLERDLHDGAQQRMLRLGDALGAVRESLRDTVITADTARLLGQAEDELRAAVTELRELARGIHPATLTVRGLRPALELLVMRCAGRTVLDVADLPRLDPTVEATAYFVVSEALANAARHARAETVRVGAGVAGGRLLVRVADDGAGGAVPGPESGLTGLADRVAAVGGTLTVHSPPGKGTVLTADLPAAPPGAAPLDPPCE
ncbi:sensor histidine kinase [Actinomadura roseirufa]|uniref:sensor histidine kinase n=1 Tax=Actinomadura roseirufa TaxID=2094049 RepID=UPI001041905B|nr:ATP-binding protein [Actinomadura roseirufa]